MAHTAKFHPIPRPISQLCQKVAKNGVEFGPQFARQTAFSPRYTATAFCIISVVGHTTCRLPNVVKTGIFARAVIRHPNFATFRPNFAQFIHRPLSELYQKVAKNISHLGNISHVGVNFAQYFNDSIGDRRVIVRMDSPLLLFCWVRYKAYFPNSISIAAVSQY